ncbi:uncharacterized protein LOC133861538 [Alnus glutinosa]|uniref:uncharacterized protein LOC133861538 n=1 Tax=Alnus glutinosa TaxID=3517 RepID=UPI002D78335F|nr:uncharacterized protein LOC133861538 [Alnus glutinosa]
MKFFFRSCYRPKCSPSPPHEEANADANTDTHVSASLIVPSSRRNRLSSSASKSKSAAAAAAAKHWRPRLSMISEDNAGYAAKVFDKNCAARVSDKKSSSKPRSFGNSRSIADLDEYSCRNNSAPIVFPAFSPTPFMF